MSVLKDKQELRKVFLPSTADLAADDPNKDWVLLDVSSSTVGDIMNVVSGDSAGMTAVKALIRRIHEWSYTDEAGSPVEINAENIQKLDLDDFSFLNKQINEDTDGLSDDEKKA